MADLIVDRNDIVVRLAPWEAVAACRRQVRVPVRALRMVQVEEAPLGTLARWRLPGFYWPGSLVLGTGRRRGCREFAAARAGQAAVVLDLDGSHWDRLVVSCPDAKEVAAGLAALVLERGPGGDGGKGRKPPRPGAPGTLDRSRSPGRLGPPAAARPDRQWPVLLGPVRRSGATKRVSEPGSADRSPGRAPTRAAIPAWGAPGKVRQARRPRQGVAVAAGMLDPVQGGVGSA